MDKQLEEATQGSLKNLRRILASDGALQGFYCYIGNDKGTEATLIVTLAAKDKSGTMAASQGKALRALVTKPKISHGIVSIEKGKLFFDHQKGTATPALMKKGFKTTLSTLKNLQFLKKAVFKGGEEEASSSAGSGAPDPDETETGTITAADLGMGTGGAEALRELLAQDPDLADFFSADNTKRSAALLGQSRALQSAFDDLDQQDDPREQGLEEATTFFQDFQIVKDPSPEQVQALEKARVTLATSARSGPSPFPDRVGATVDARLLPLVDGARRVNLATLTQRILDLRAQIAEIPSSSDDLATLEQALQALEDLRTETRQVSQDVTTLLD